MALFFFVVQRLKGLSKLVNQGFDYWHTSKILERILHIIKFWEANDCNLV